jgi:hypothetical protein
VVQGAGMWTNEESCSQEWTEERKRVQQVQSSWAPLCVRMHEGSRGTMMKTTRELKTRQLPT